MRTDLDHLPAAKPLWFGTGKQQVVRIDRVTEVAAPKGKRS